jgi:hypothetical protein
MGQKHRPQAEPGIVLGVCWYRADQWERLLATAADRKNLEDTHAEWLASATKGLFQMRAAGITVDPVEVDVEDMLRWCRVIGRPFDRAARAEYVAELLRKRHEPGAR